MEEGAMDWWMHLLLWILGPVLIASLAYVKCRVVDKVNHNLALVGVAIYTGPYYLVTMMIYLCYLGN